MPNDAFVWFMLLLPVVLTQLVQAGFVRLTVFLGASWLRQAFTGELARSAAAAK